MESLSEFACHLQRDKLLMSMDIVKGYRLLRLHPSMRDLLLFAYNGQYYQCVALPFVCGRSPLWFTKTMSPFSRALRAAGYRVLAYLDDFLIAPTPFGTPSTSRDFERARRKISALMRSLGLKRHPSKGNLEGTTQLELFGVMVDTNELRFTVTPGKQEKVRIMANKMLQMMRYSRRWVSHSLVTNFCGVCFALSLAMPWARFYTRALYWDAAKRFKAVRGKLLCRLSHQSLRDLKFWRTLSQETQHGRLMHPAAPEAALHTDAADMGSAGP